MLRRIFSRTPTGTLTPVQKKAHASEQEGNFRWIACFASRSKTSLTADNKLKDSAIYSFIERIGQYAEIAHGSILPRFVFDHLEYLSRPGCPLDGYDALMQDKPVLVDHFEGTVAHVQGYVVYREQDAQLVVAISGTSSFIQAYYDMHCRKAPYSEDGEHIKVHSGFWKMYEGLRRSAMKALTKGLEDYKAHVNEIVVTGHSMGGSLSYFLMLDIMKTLDHTIPYTRRPKLRLVVFGAPRVGNEALANFWEQRISEYRGDETDMFQEYSLKAHKDGAHILPPHCMGFRHLTRLPLYLLKEDLYQIPIDHQEYGAFKVDPIITSYATDATIAASAASLPKSDIIETDRSHFSWPLGGHNYYFRDMERLRRRWSWLGLSPKAESDEGWKNRYEAKLKKWQKASAKNCSGVFEDLAFYNQLVQLITSTIASTVCQDLSPSQDLIPQVVPKGWHIVLHCQDSAPYARTLQLNVTIVLQLLLSEGTGGNNKIDNLALEVSLATIKPSVSPPMPTNPLFMES